MNTPKASESPKTRVLLISASIGGGHDAVTSALANQLEKDGAAVMVRDFYDAQIPGLSRLVARFNRIWLLRLGWAYQWTWDRLSHRGAFARFACAFLRITAMPAMRRLVARFEPDVVVATYPMCVPAFGALRRRGGMSACLVARVTDFVAHALWVDPGVDLYLTANRESAAWLERFGIRAPIRVSDLPVREPFLRLPDRAAAKEALGLDPARPLILATGGGDGVGHLDEVVTALSDLSVNVAVVCGRNEGLRRKIAALGTRALVFGYVADMERKLAAADILVGTPGPTSCCEAFLASTPVVTYRPYNGQGIENADWVVKREGGWIARTPAELRCLVTGLINDRALLHGASVRASRLADRHAAETNAHAVLEARRLSPRLQPSPPRPRARGATAAIAVAALLIPVVGLSAWAFSGPPSVGLPLAGPGPRAAVLAGIVVALVSSLACNLGVAVQKRAAMRLPPMDGLNLRTWRAFVSDRSWRVGNALTISAWVIQCVALALAPVALVYPAMASGIFLLALLARRWFDERLRLPEIVGAALCVLGILLQSLSVDGASSAAGTMTDLRALGAVVLALVGGAGGVLLVVRRRPALAEPGLSLAAGLLYTGTGLLTKALCNAVGRSWAEAVLCAGGLAVLGIAALAILQAAYQKGRAVVVATITGVPADFLPVCFAPMVFGEIWPAGHAGAERILATAAILLGFLLLVRPASLFERRGNTAAADPVAA